MVVVERRAKVTEKEPCTCSPGFRGEWSGQAMGSQEMALKSRDSPVAQTCRP